MIQSSTSDLIGGFVTFWTSTEKVDKSRLTLELTSANIPAKFMPKDRPQSAILKDALNDACGGPKVLVRPLADKTGFAVVEEERGTNRNRYEERFTCKVDDLGNLSFSGDYQDDESKVREEFRKWQGYLTSAQITALLVGVIASFNGTALRPKGGVYWLAGRHYDGWTVLCNAIEAAANSNVSIYTITHQLNEKTVRAVHDAVVKEIEDDVGQLYDAIMNEDLGQRALATKKTECEILRNKAKEYEAILSVSLKRLIENIDVVENAAITAALATTTPVNMGTPALV